MMKTTKMLFMVFILGIILLFPTKETITVEVRTSQAPVFQSVTQNAEILNSTQQQSIIVDVTASAGIDNVTITWFAEPLNTSVNMNNPPYIPFTDIRGDNRSTWESKGRITVIDFWATWCGPCAEEMKELVPFYANYSDYVDIYSIGVDSSETVEMLAEYAPAHGMTWSVGRDYSKANDLLPWNVTAIPTVCILAPNSTLMDWNEGTASEWYLETKITPLIPFVQPRNNTVVLGSYGPLRQAIIGPFPDQSRVFYYFTAYERSDSHECTIDTNGGKYFTFAVSDSGIIPETSTSESTTLPTQTSFGFELIYGSGALLILTVVVQRKKE